MSQKPSSSWPRWNDFEGSLSDRLWSFGWYYLTPFIVAFTLFFVLQDLGPSFRARFGDDGIRGHVTVTSKDCSGKGGCSYSGDFESETGGDRRHDMLLGSGFQGESVGKVFEAYDVGDRGVVYPPGGGQDWIYTALITIGALGALLVWILLVPVRGFRRRSAWG